MKQQDVDIKDFVSFFPLKDEVKDKHFCVTGATGLIGSVLVKCLLALDASIKVTVPVRNREKAMAVFGDLYGRLIVEQFVSLEEWSDSLEQRFDYIVHCASPTNGKFMQENPVDTFALAYQSTYNLLRTCQRMNIQGFVYLSSLEYYGQILDDSVPVTEDVQGFVDSVSARSSYPLGKRAAEYLCYAFATQYGVNAKVARLTQTFGAGVAPDDNRVFAQFVRSIINNKNIVLHTAGASAKPYCYTTDCISAILYILLKGDKGQAYNVANDESYISIKELANFLCATFNPSISVSTELHNDYGYAPETKLRLSTGKLKALGWKPQYSLKEMFERLIVSFND